MPFLALRNVVLSICHYGLIILISEKRLQFMYKFCVLSAYVCERLLILRDNVAVMQHLNHAALYPCFPQLTDHGTWSSGTTPLYVPVICRLPKIFTARVWACIFYADIDTNRYLAPSRAAYQRHLPWVHFKVPTGRLEIDRYVI